jgi:hypothetical protein
VDPWSTVSLICLFFCTFYDLSKGERAGHASVMKSLSRLLLYTVREINNSSVRCLIARSQIQYTYDFHSLAASV